MVTRQHHSSGVARGAGHGRPKSTIVYLPAGQFHFGGGAQRVHTLLGTCVAITVWHPQRLLGGICHFLLPTRVNSAEADPSTPGLYADEAMQLFTDALRNSRTKPDDYMVKIMGGGQMFPQQSTDRGCDAATCVGERQAVCPGIGCKNIVAARRLLRASGFRIDFEHVGGSGSRQVVFDLRTGDVWIKRGAPLCSAEAAA